jgi:hypothetical protein
MKTSALARVDTARLEGLIHDIDCFDYTSGRIFAPSATNPGQEGLGIGRTSSLCASSLVRHSKAESRRHCIPYFDYISYDEE